MPGLKKAELIEGVVYMPSPVRHEQHSNPHSRLVGWLWAYTTGTPGVESGDNGSIRLDLRNMPQPDAYLIVRPERGGQVRISEDDYIEGGPELVAEVSASSVSYDLGKKQGVYRRNEVQRVHRLAGPRPRDRLVRPPRRAATSAWSRGPTASSAARSSPASGSTRPR